jgi:methylase of polypeptide subunit release factors
MKIKVFAKYLCYVFCFAGVTSFRQPFKSRTSRLQLCSNRASIVASGATGNSLDDANPVQLEAWVAQFKAANELSLVRSHSTEARAAAKAAHISALRVRPERLRVDGTLAVGYAVNDVLAAFGESSSEVQVSSATRQLRAAFSEARFTASVVRHRFGLPEEPSFGVGVLLAKRVAGILQDSKLTSESLDSVDFNSLTALEAFIQLFVLGLALPTEAVALALGPITLIALRQLGLVGDCPDVGQKPSEWLVASSAITPLAVPRYQADGDQSTARKASSADSGGTVDVWIATDWRPPVAVALTEEPVMYLGPDSIALLRHLPDGCLTDCSGDTVMEGHSSGNHGQQSSKDSSPDSKKVKSSTGRRGGRWLDLCCGSGVQGVCALASGRCERLDLVDVNPRALRFTRFNLRLNRLRSFGATYRGDLFQALPPKSKLYDVILANPPFVPVPPELFGPNSRGSNAEIKARRYDVFSADPSGAGDGILRRILQGAPKFLRPAHFKQGKITEAASARLESTSNDSGVGVDSDAVGAHEEALAAFIADAIRKPAFDPAGRAKPTAIVLRGISGSGKSTVAAALVRAAEGSGRPAVVCSADAYFLDPTTGEYLFDPTKLPAAHAACLASFESALSMDVSHTFVSSNDQKLAAPPVVIVDNTNTKRWEYAKYEDHARRVGAQLKFLELVAPRSATSTLSGSGPTGKRSASRSKKRGSSGARSGSSVKDSNPAAKAEADAARVSACAERNVHGVPLAVVSAMQARWQPDSRATQLPASLPMADSSRSSETVGGTATSTARTICTSAKSVGSNSGGGTLAIVTELPNPHQWGDTVLQPIFDAQLNDRWRIEGDSISVRGAVVVDAVPSSAEEYVTRRAGSGKDLSSEEAQAWQQHLVNMGIKSMGNALVFMQAIDHNSAVQEAESPSVLEHPKSPRKAAVRTFQAPKVWSATDKSSHASICEAASWVHSIEE